MKAELVTTLGSITVELDPENAPKTVANFIAYAENGHYDGTIFHRVIEDFIIQGGGFDHEMKSKSTQAPIRNEANNGLKNEYGTLAMARTNNPHSASTEFFINTNDNDFLDFTAEHEYGWGYCVFGKVIDGIDVVKQIEEEPTTRRSGHSDVPKTNIIIEAVKIL